MDTNRDLAVDWSEFCQYIAKGLAEKEIVDHEQENPVMMCAQKFNSKHLGRIVRFESYSSPTRFVSICDDAIACFWNSKMTITQVTHMDSASFISPRASLKVTDACYMPNASTIVICTNARDMRSVGKKKKKHSKKLSRPRMCSRTLVGCFVSPGNAARQ